MQTIEDSRMLAAKSRSLSHGRPSSPLHRAALSVEGPGDQMAHESVPDFTPSVTAPEHVFILGGGACNFPPVQ